MEIGSVPRHWWAFALRGLAAVIFGILAFAWPGLTLATLVLLFGIFVLIDAVMAIISAIRSKGDHVWVLLLEGVVAVVAGVLVLGWPGITALLLLYIIAAWAIVSGILEIVSAVRLRTIIEHEWAWILSGALSIVFGVVAIARPGAGALAIIWLIGAYAILFGITLFFVAWRIRDLEQSEHGHRGGAGVHQPVVP
jgi:uncharacterized membrane protein HdeD (DUF308 family)